MANYTGYLQDKNGNKLTVNSGSMGNIIVDNIECRNLLPNYSSSGTYGGVTATQNVDGSITFNGTATENISNFSFYVNLTLEPGTYTHSIFNSAPTGLYLSLNNTHPTMVGLAGQERSATFTIDSETTYTQYFIWIDAGITFDNFTIYPQIELGTKETYYVPHKEFVNKIYSNAAGFHNSIFRGEDITRYYEDNTLYARIWNGSFDDLFVGDYIVVNNITWRIAGFDICLYKGRSSSNKFTKHHAIIVPDAYLTTGQFNTTATTEGGYVNSNMVNVVLPEVLSTYITPVFGDHVIEYESCLTNSIDATGPNQSSINGGCTNGYEWVSRKIDLMNENQVFGSVIASSSIHEVGIDNIQFPLFRLAPEFIYCRKSWLLRNIASATQICYISNSGRADGTIGGANANGAIRPYFYID